MLPSLPYTATKCTARSVTVSSAIVRSFVRRKFSLPATHRFGCRSPNTMPSKVPPPAASTVSSPPPRVDRSGSTAQTSSVFSVRSDVNGAVCTNAPLPSSTSRPFATVAPPFSSPCSVPTESEASLSNDQRATGGTPTAWPSGFTRPRACDSRVSIFFATASRSAVSLFRAMETVARSPCVTPPSAAASR